MNEQNQNENNGATMPQPANVETVTLDEPIKRSGQTITTITLRKPRAGELRGTSLMSLAQMDVSALKTILPRICDPMLAPQEIDALDPADMMALGLKVAGFFMTKAERASFPTS